MLAGRVCWAVSGEIKRIATACNTVVVQLPERALPGVVIQGDSLRNVTRVAEAAVEHLHDGDLEEGIGLVEEAATLLAGYLAMFEAALRQPPA